MKDENLKKIKSPQSVMSFCSLLSDFASAYALEFNEEADLENLQISWFNLKAIGDAIFSAD